MKERFKYGAGILGIGLLLLWIFLRENYPGVELFWMPMIGIALVFATFVLFFYDGVKDLYESIREEHYVEALIIFLCMMWIFFGAFLQNSLSRF